MRLTINKSVSKLVGIWTFLLLLIFKGIFPQSAYAFLSSLDACAVKPECAAAVGSELAPTIAAPTAEAAGTTAISTTTATGVTTSSVEAVAGTTVVGDMRLSGVAAFYIWNRAQNEQAQNKAKERYCSFYPLDWVCGPQGQSSVLYNYKFHETVHYRRSGYPDKFVTYHYRNWQSVPGPIRSLANQYPGSYFGGSYPPSSDYVGYIRLNDGGGNNQTRGVVLEYATGDTMTWDDYLYIYCTNNAEKGWISDLVRADGLPDNSPPRDWKDWPQEKRDAAVQLLNKSDWQGLILSMPAGGLLNPGDKVNAPTIVIPGQETDDPNTPADERLLKKESGFFTNPGRDDFDYDADGTADASDPEPQNPSVPTASGGSSGSSSNQSTNPSDSNQPLDTSQEPRPEPLSEIPETGRARDLAEAKAAELYENLGNKAPTATAAAVDTETGKVYYGTSGKPLPTTIDEYLAERMPVPSEEPWEVANCAEFKAVNDALLDGANMRDLEVHTVRTKSGQAYPRCRNCRKTIDGANVTSDP